MHHCAWCGDEPDEHGSHGICPMHAAEQWQRYQEAKAERLARQQEQEQEKQAA